MKIIHLTLALLACGITHPGATGDAHASGRFGDSTWVAPGAPGDDAINSDGPRVAPRDYERRWETAMRAPFRLAFLPLRLVGNGLEAGMGYAGPRFLEPKPKHPARQGLAVRPYINLDAVNDVSLGPDLTWVGFPTTNSRLRLAGSWSTISHRRVHFSAANNLPRSVGFRLRADYDDKPNRRYYGIGNVTPATNRSYFMLESTSAEAALLLGVSPLRQLRVSGGYSGMNPRRGSHGQPLLEDVFSPAATPFEHQRTQELWYGVSGDLAALDDGRDPSRGVHGRMDLRRATGMRSGDPDYNQWRLEGRAYVPVFAKRRVIAVRGVYAGVEPRGGATTTLPFYRLAESAGVSTFAGYGSGRFRDRQLVLARAEYRWEILYRLSALGLYELGEVAPSRRAFSLHGTHNAWGGGLRLGMSAESALRVELARGTEGIHASLVLGSDF